MRRSFWEAIFAGLIILVLGLLITPAVQRVRNADARLTSMS
jgi:hypothetical protein